MGEIKTKIFTKNVENSLEDIDNKESYNPLKGKD